MIAHWLFVAFVGAQALDIGSTITKLHQGCTEQVWRGGPAVIVGAKAGGVVFTWSIHESHPKLSVGLSVLGIASGLYGGAHNLKTECGR